MAEQDYQFGPFVFDSKRRLLLRHGSPVAIGQKGLVILETLLAAGAQAVSKSALMDAAWRTENIEESNLSVQIAALRKCLGTSKNGGEWIATVQRVGYQFVNPDEANAASRASESAAVAQVSGDKPSIAVLPFVNMSGDPEQEYFADGIVEEIITALSRFSALFVIARNSSFVYKGRNVDVKQVARELGVRYILEGSVRKVANRVRIAGQLIDAGSGAHLWADRFDGELIDIFDLQDNVTARVVGAIAPKLEKAEIERSRRKPTENLDAYDYYLRGLAAMHQWTRQGNDEALAHFHRAIGLDSGFALAHGFAARTYVQRKTLRWTRNPDVETADAEMMVRRSLELGSDDAVVLCTAGFGLLDIMRDFDGADALFERALSMNPNLAMAWWFSGWSKVSLGESNLAITRVERALELNPQDPQAISMYAALSCAHFVAGRYEEALRWNEKAERERSSLVLQSCVGAACLALCGRVAEARKKVERALQAAPELNLLNVNDVMYFKRPEDTERWLKGLRLAGLPE